MNPSYVNINNIFMEKNCVFQKWWMRRVTQFNIFANLDGVASQIASGSSICCGFQSIQSAALVKKMQRRFRYLIKSGTGSILIIFPIIYGYSSLVQHQDSKSGSLQRLAAMNISDWTLMNVNKKWLYLRNSCSSHPWDPSLCLPGEQTQAFIGWNSLKSK